MQILFIRHGEAVDEAPGLGDTGRWLTGKGRRVTRQVGDWLTESDDRRPATIWTSPLVRAVQTAEIIAERCAIVDDLSVLGSLATNGDPRDVLHRVQKFHGDGPLALVGHEPSLSTLAVTLLGDVQWPGFKKSGVLSVTWDRKGRAAFGFLLHPKDMSVMTELRRAGGL